MGRPNRPIAPDSNEGNENKNGYKDEYYKGQSTADSGESLGLPPARLALTFGFGAGLFSKGGVDRYGLAKHRPEALVEMPKFHGDELIEGKSGGDLSVQACSDTHKSLSTRFDNSRALPMESRRSGGPSRVFSRVKTAAKHLGT